jgi:streptomycin 6-kinase
LRFAYAFCGKQAARENDVTGISSPTLRQGIEAAMGRWRLVPDGPVRTTPTGFVAFVRQGSDRRVLKIIGFDPDEANSAAVLGHYGGRGAVEAIAHRGRAILLERIEPGHHLTDLVVAGNDDAATIAVCEVMRALHRGDPPIGPFATVETWGESFADHQRAGGPLPAATVDRARGIYAELSRSQGPRFVLHGDLHHDNVLYDAARGWLAIDPKGVIGEAAYETGAMLRNPTEETALFATPAVIDRRVRILCERCAFDRARVLGWCFSQAVLAALWASEDGTEDKRGLATAEATLALM